MGDKDKVEKILESFNDVFADIVNGCLFDGEQVAQEEEFMEATPYGYYKADGSIREQSRDVAKYWQKGEIIISLVGIENQTDPDPYMPIRVMSYDAASYRAQIADKNIRGPHPVMSIVLYLGYKYRWNEPLTVRGCLRIPNVIDQFVYDYQMNLFQIAWMSQEEIDRRFHGDFWIVADYLHQKQVNKDYRPSERQFRHVRETLELLRVIERDDRFVTECQEIMMNNNSDKEGWTMCDVLDRVENRGIEKGIQMERENTAKVLDAVENRGIQKGREEGYRSAQRDTVRKMRIEGLSEELIARIIGTDIQTVQGMVREAN